MTQRTVVVGPGEPRWVAWLMHQQGYWLRCHWHGHAGEWLCYRCGTRLQTFVSNKVTEELLDGLPPGPRETMAYLLDPDTITVGRDG